MGYYRCDDGKYRDEDGNEAPEKVIQPSIVVEAPVVIPPESTADKKSQPDIGGVLIGILVSILLLLLLLPISESILSARGTIIDMGGSVTEVFGAQWESEPGSLGLDVGTKLKDPDTLAFLAPTSGSIRISIRRTPLSAWEALGTVSPGSYLVIFRGSRDNYDTYKRNMGF